MSAVYETVSPPGLIVYRKKKNPSKSLNFSRISMRICPETGFHLRISIFQVPKGLKKVKKKIFEKINAYI